MLLATKLFVPRPPARAVPRTRLFERLEQAEGSALTLLSAPAGFGKTALVGGWIRERREPAAWLALDELDDDPRRFWTYVIEALRIVDEGVAESGLELLRSPQLPLGEAIATTVINDLTSSPRRFVCVLDDYHVIAAEAIHRGVVFLVEHMPPNARLIVTTRADPPWPLARLRASGRMTELRAADLRFTDDEARLLLDAADLSIPVDDVRMLESRTEGWIAGLQMAVLSMQNHADPSRFIRDFAGSHRFVIDYLAQEVLARQTEAMRSFLVRTSILERLNGELCDAVTGREDGQRILEELEQTNLFTEPLDDERRWYRYHQLFAEVLRSELSQLEPELLPELHDRASRWHEEHGLDPEAVYHALEGGNVERAADLIVRTASATFMVSNQLLVLKWLDKLPAEAIASTPLLALVDAWARFVTGDWEGMVPALEVASESIGSAAASSEREALQPQLDGIRAWIAYQTGDLEGCVALATAALERMPADSLVPRRIVSSAQGYGLLLLGQTEGAKGVANETVAESRRAGDALTECLAIALEAQAYLLDGELERAARTYERALAAGTIGGEPLPSVAIAQIQLAEVMRERDQLVEAERTLTTAIAACEEALGLPEWVFEGNVTLARVLAAEGDPEGSRQALARAESVLDHELIPGGMLPIVGRALDYRTRYWLATDQVERAAAWLAKQGVSAEERPHDPRRTPSLLLARTLLAQGEHVRAIRLVDRLLGEADSGNAGLAVELQLVRALLLHALRRDAEAVEATVAAVRAAEPEGYVRIFVDKGKPMMRLLERAAVAQPPLAGYVGRLLEAFGPRERHPAEAPALGGNGALRDPLNERELEILRMFAAGRSNREIAGGLYLSVNTVKWHARNLYGKLGVNRRALAVARARELGIL